VTTISACRLCGSPRLFQFLSLGSQPLANAVLDPKDVGKPETRYPIDVVLCEECTGVQITETISPDILFRDYIYFSSFSDTMLKHAEEEATELRTKRRLGPDSLVVEIASNDGYLLKHFVAAGVPVLGVEPARNIAKVAAERGIRTVAEFFGREFGAQLARDGYQADVMLANNVMAHVPDINGVVAGIKILLKPGGVFVMETPYVKDMIDNLEFDTMYHEHFFCHSLTALEKLYRSHGLAACDVRWIPIHGGTIQVWVSHAGEEGARPAVAKMLADEKGWGVDQRRFYADFGTRVERLRDDVVGTLDRLRADGKRIGAYGAAAKGATLMNYMGIDGRHVDYVLDRSTYKQGKLMPGNHVPILAPEHLLNDQPDYLLILAWNLADEIMGQQAEYRARGGRFIVPVPTVRVI
jgi:SAM-dependent methyltransferase